MNWLINCLDVGILFGKIVKKRNRPQCRKWILDSSLDAQVFCGSGKTWSQLRRWKSNCHLVNALHTQILKYRNIHSSKMITFAAEKCTKKPTAKCGECQVEGEQKDKCGCDDKVCKLHPKLGRWSGEAMSNVHPSLLCLSISPPTYNFASLHL